MFRLQIFDWINEYTNKIVDFVLNIFLSLPGIFQFLLLIAIAFLSIVGLVRVATKALKTVIGIASAFLVLLVIWLLFFR